MLVYRCAWMLDHGSPAIRESSTAKFFCGEGLWQTVDDAIQMLGGYGYISHEYMIERIWRDARVVRVYDGSSEVQQILIDVYRRDPKSAGLCERLVDLDEGVQEWRYRHVKMVERTIGTKRGTGGSAGAEYLRTTLGQPAFPDLWEIRSLL